MTRKARVRHLCP